MRAHLGMVVVVAVTSVGCMAEMPETGETTQAMSRQCPDPEEPCPVGNGFGVYTEEHGNAHVGSDDLMLTRFVNTTGGVNVFGRGLDWSGSGNYVPYGGTVVGATYNGMGYSVASVAETLTVPKFMLRQGSATPFPVEGDDIVNLRLEIQIEGVSYVLSFWNPQTDTGTSGNQATLHTFYMRWNPGKTFNWSTSEPYCYRSPLNGSAPDPIVFQQGIGVHPLTAVMGRNDSLVTLSCRHGAIATVRWWGYIYRGNAAASDMFEAAMHMKRASYCGDDTFFTRANTEILIKDTIPNQQGAVTVSQMEASWGRVPGGPVRALCVNPLNLRRPNKTYYGNPFDPTCNGTVSPPIPDCQTWGGGLGPLADQSAP
jgi:hypothetical protein